MAHREQCFFNHGNMANLDHPMDPNVWFYVKIVDMLEISRGLPQKMTSPDLGKAASCCFPDPKGLVLGFPEAASFRTAMADTLYVLYIYIYTEIYIHILYHILYMYIYMIHTHIHVCSREILFSLHS